MTGRKKKNTARKPAGTRAPSKEVRLRGKPKGEEGRRTNSPSANYTGRCRSKDSEKQKTTEP